MTYRLLLNLIIVFVLIIAAFIYRLITRYRARCKKDKVSIMEWWEEYMYNNDKK